MNSNLEMEFKKKSLFSIQKPTPFQFVWFGLMISIFGNHLNKVGLIWYVNNHFDGAMGGVILGVSMSIPMAIIGIITGVIVDRCSKLTILIAADLIQAILVFSLVFLFFITTPNLLTISIFSAVLGVVGLLSYPTIQSLIPDLSQGDKEKNTMMTSWVLGTMTTVGIIAPSVASMMVTIISVKWILFLDGISFLSSLTMTFLMIKSLKVNGINTYIPSVKKKNILVDTHTGLKFIFKHPVLAPQFITLPLLEATTYAIPFLLPNLISETVEGKAEYFGICMAIGMVGRILSMVIFPKTPLKNKRGIVFSANLVIQGVAIILIALSTNIWMIILGFFLLGIPAGMAMISLTSYIQEETPKEMRGRIFSNLKSLTTFIKPLGLIGIGAIAEWDSIHTSFLLAGILVLMGGLFLTSRSAIRKVT